MNDRRTPGNEPPNGEPPREMPRSQAELRALVSSIVQETIEARTSGPRLLVPTHPLRAVLVAVFLVSVGFLIASAGIFRRAPTVPLSILGTWVTDAPAYKNRSFEITPTSVIFAAPGVDARAYPIRRVTHSVQDGADRYVIRYEQDGAPAELALSVRERVQHGEIRFTHQPAMSWHRAP